MKVLIANPSGNVGKTFLAKELFYAQMENPSLFGFENINTADINEKNGIHKFNLSQTKEFFIQYHLAKNVVIDIGSPLTYNVLNELDKLKVLSDMDLIVVPTVIDAKQIADTIKFLSEINKKYDAANVAVIVNMVDDTESKNKFEQEYLQNILSEGVKKIYYVPKFNGTEMLQSSNTSSKDFALKAEELEKQLEEEKSKEIPNADKIREIAQMLFDIREVEEIDSRLGNLFLDIANDFEMRM